MQISHDCVALVKALEGLRLTAYDCPAGVLTIGYGHTGADVRPGERITQPVAEQLLMHDLETAVAAVADVLTKRKITATQPQIDALVSFAFNVGSGAMAKSSVVKRLVAGDVPGAAEVLLAWNKARVGGQLVPLAGLTRRREAERALFLGDAPRAFAIAGVLDGPMAQAVEPPAKEKSLHASPTISAGLATIFGGAATALTAATQLAGAAGELVTALPVPAPWFLAILGIGTVAAGVVVVVRRYGYWASADKIESTAMNFGQTLIKEAPDVANYVHSVADAARDFGGVAGPVAAQLGSELASFSQLLARARADRSNSAINAKPVGVDKRL